jgi:predicted secreted Zn-dependent protease
MIAKSGSVWRTAPLCLILLVWQLPTHGEVSEQIHYKDYPAEHRAGRTLLSALNEGSPIRQQGNIFHGYTSWRIEWRFRWWEESDGRCRITENRTRLLAEITLPKLATKDSEAMAAFTHYLSALRAHELTHVKIARDYAGRIDRGILNLPEMKSCRTLEDAANRLGHQLLQQATSEEKEMDKLTAHGRTQGAFLAR